MKISIDAIKDSCLLFWKVWAFTVFFFLPPLQGSYDSAEVEKVMSSLDENQDGEVDFQEFVVLVAALTMACNEFFIDFIKKQGSK